MIKWTRRAVVDGGSKMPQAIAFAKDITEYVTSQGNATRCWIQQYGQMGVIVWEADFQNAGDMEERMNALLSKEEYWQKLGAAEGLFIAGKTHDAVYQQLN